MTARKRPKRTLKPWVRFVSMIEESDDGCWLWQGALKSNGYGRVDRSTLAHRWAYQAFVGPIPDDLVVDHLCRRKSCVNPLHMELVTIAENVRRHFRLQTHCRNGHEFTPENTYRYSDGVRKCRTCHRTQQGRYGKTEKVLARRRERYHQKAAL